MQPRSWIPAADRAADARGRAQGGGPFIGTTGLDGSTLTALLRDVVRELARHGVRRILVLVRVLVLLCL